jgi:hypothetical protein
LVADGAGLVKELWWRLLPNAARLRNPPCNVHAMGVLAGFVTQQPLDSLSADGKVRPVPEIRVRVRYGAR